MTVQEEESCDKTIPDLAVQALSAASKRAIKLGRTIVFVKEDRLIRRGPSGDVVVKVLTPRQKVELNGARRIHER